MRAKSQSGNSNTVSSDRIEAGAYGLGRSDDGDLSLTIGRLVARTPDFRYIEDWMTRAIVAPELEPR
jgi:hypothetical protein